MTPLHDVHDDADLRRLFGRFPTGVIALCAMDHGEPVGMTASTFVAVSIDPPLTSVCIKQGSGAWRRLRRQARVGISFLSHVHAATARQLAQKTGDRFLGLDHEATAGGAVFLADATAWLECSIEKEIGAGDHDLVLFRLHRGAVAFDARPLVFHSSDFHTLVRLEEGRMAGAKGAKAIVNIAGARA
ncbi:flavin reductase family protein [Brevundimonas sp. SORGH_AS_0993]|uniref:flavin reductase family protein n=1 Tax=Brevundimonas sp. SORGH_AS_0993 TaxID=3041794 RepID=UPI002783E7DC|nr:flavin reductase family protein [Brevundimonas sp. SORGH_AS_0993]MDQ1154182.1 flavin reductase (DIM6/NTAB) family NADH-FMN oxidoreductase RutF [Brevundimonas sp. SORGH_AS_0993]